MHVRARRCERAREWVSLQVDGELSELEGALLASHLERCDDCSLFRADVGGISAGLREAPLERLERPIVLPVRARFGGRALQGMAAAAAVVAVGLGSTLGVLTADRSSSERFARSSRPAYLDSADYEMRLIRHVQGQRLLAALARTN